MMAEGSPLARPRVHLSMARHTPPFGTPLRLAWVVGLAVAVALVTLPGAGRAQTPLDVLRTLQQGGGWVSIPVVQGSGEISTRTVRTPSLNLSGCVTVWGGHSGEWTLKANDPLNGGRLETVVRPGEGTPFSYETGPQSRLDVRVRWSEPRDTVLLLWIGLEGVASRPDACVPVYGGG